jgi:hypothetical protein
LIQPNDRQILDLAVVVSALRADFEPQARRYSRSRHHQMTKGLAGFSRRGYKKGVNHHGHHRF